jgi:transposase-like protein
LSPRTKQALDLFRDGKDVRVIAELMGVKTRRLQVLLRQAGIRRRVGRPSNRKLEFASGARCGMF